MNIALRRSYQSLISCCMILVMFALGCTPAPKQTTLQIVTAINAKAPEIIAAADTVAATIAILDPEDAARIGVANAAFDAGSNLIRSLAASYIANPDAATLQHLQDAVNTLEAQINTATLSAAGIKNLDNQRLALAALKGLLTVVTIVFGLISQTETVSMLKQLRDTHTIQLARVRPYMDQQRLQTAANEQGIGLDAMFSNAEAHGF